MHGVNGDGHAVRSQIPGYECGPGGNLVTGLCVPEVTRLLELLHKPHLQ